MRWSLVLLLCFFLGATAFPAPATAGASPPQALNKTERPPLTKRLEGHVARLGKLDAALRAVDQLKPKKGLTKAQLKTLQKHLAYFRRSAARARALRARMAKVVKRRKGPSAPSDAEAKKIEKEYRAAMKDQMRTALSREAQMVKLLGGFSALQEQIYAAISGGAKA